jgi:cyclophilin family peptidyl-prolyl cis-trans isomerase
VNPAKTYTFPGVLPAEQIQNKQIRITTARGDIVFELYPDTAPMAVSSFVYLTSEGYYDGLIFHRRDEGFVIQGGDPLGTGRGGPGYRFNDELADSYTYDRGVVAMANSGSNTNGSQFFIMLADYPLPKKYTIFGRVTEGMEVVDQIKIGDEMLSVKVEDKHKKYRRELRRQGRDGSNLLEVRPAADAAEAVFSFDGLAVFHGVVDSTRHLDRTSVAEQFDRDRPVGRNSSSVDDTADIAIATGVLDVYLFVLRLEAFTDDLGPADDSRTAGDGIEGLDDGGNDQPGEKDQHAEKKEIDGRAEDEGDYDAGFFHS